MKKTWLIPILLATTSLPLVLITSCNKTDPSIINVNLNKDRTFHLESKPFSLEEDKTYTLFFDLTKWEMGDLDDTGARIITFTNEYLPNITFFNYGSVPYGKANSIEDIGYGIAKYYVGNYSGKSGVFFFTPSMPTPDKCNVKFLSETKETNMTVELNGH